MYSVANLDISYVKLLFGCLAFGVLILSILVNTFDKRLPKFLADVYKYGKFADKNPSMFIIMVPKSWFRHFYVVGVICTGIISVIMLNLCLLDQQPSPSIASLLDVVASRQRKTSGTSLSSLLGISLLFTHCVARLVETHFISVFSRSEINIAHYISGLVHYIGSAVAIAAESPGFTNNRQCNLSLHDLTVFECFGVLIFCVASYEQLKSAIILAKLRKNKTGSVYTYKHMIPRGRLFEVLSSPHIMAEIVIYMSLTCILRSNQTWWFVFAWVLINQISTSWSNHKWYKENFPNYPKERRAFLPYLL